MAGSSGKGTAGPGYRFVKRVCDIAAAAGGLLLVWPLVGAAGLAVLLDSGTPIFYRSRRMGRHGKPFDLLKLRTMAPSKGQKAPEVTASTDRRITRAGRWLRRTKVDELPQLWNVLVGDVSLVGPRPEVQRYIDRYPDEYAEILRVRPGLTDRATLAYVDEEQVLGMQQNPEEYYIEHVMPQKISRYLAYARNPSLLEDVKILTLTASKLFTRMLPAGLFLRGTGAHDE